MDIPSRRRVTIHELVVAGRSYITVVVNDIPADDMLFDDPPGADFIHVGVPDILGIDDHHGAMTALVHASRVIHADGVPHTRGSDSLFQDRMNLKRSVERTCLAAGAYEDVALVLTHRRKMTARTAR